MDIVKEIGEAAVLENLAEECAELGKEALKLSRILRGENPTPAGKAETIGKLIDEMADVLTVFNTWKAAMEEKYALMVEDEINDQQEMKSGRWAMRITDWKTKKKGKWQWKA